MISLNKDPIKSEYLRKDNLISYNIKIIRIKSNFAKIMYQIKIYSCQSIFLYFKLSTKL
jgi:hypothetical protein